MGVELRQWGIYWVYWPYDDDPTGGKERPGILISSPELIANDELHFLYITSRRVDEPWCVPIIKGAAYWNATGLRDSCYCWVARCDRFHRAAVNQTKSGYALPPLQAYIDMVMQGELKHLRRLAFAPPPPTPPPPPPAAPPP